MQHLHQYLHRQIDVVKFYQTELGQDFTPGCNVPCPFHDDNQASLSIDVDGLGRYYCHSAQCGSYGTSFIGFYTQLRKVPYEFALKDIYCKYIRPAVPVDEVFEAHKQLLAAPAIQTWLLENRGISMDTIRKFKLGLYGDRVGIPIENEFELVVNVRKYDITKRSDAKMISYDKGYGRASLFPSFRLKEQKLILVEGEMDAILGNQLGLPCICSTGGANSWNEEFSRLLSGKEIIILYDQDDAGSQGASKVIENLKNYARVIKKARYPIDGVDLTDYILTHRNNVESMKAIIQGAETVYILDNVKPGTIFKKVLLQDAANPDYRGQSIEFKAHVTGKDTQPYFIPKKVQVTCLTKPEKKCRACRNTDSLYESLHTLELDQATTLSLINATEMQVIKCVKRMVKCGATCDINLKVVETEACEEIKMVAPLDEVGTDEEFKYVMRIGYVIGGNIDANATYLFRGYSYPDPDTQHVVFLLISAEPSADQLDNFQLKKEEYELLKEMFPGGESVETIHDFLDKLYSYLAVTTTKIYERRALHQAIDLVFHSALSFNFNGEFVNRGWLDVLVMGDTRTGKGYITERLCRYYRAGEVASGENCTFAGLVGGVQQVGSRKSWIVTWGFLPRNDRRLTVIDEASSVTSDTLSRMSRVRSEGVAEVFKIVTERTYSRTRIIWNANPADGRSIREFEHGIEAVNTMTSKREDIARFDYAIIVASDEIDPTVINAERPDLARLRPRLQEACQKLIQWIWSRHPNDIEFTRGATKIILQDANDLGKKYHCSIPLVQIENIRLKLAKIAVAIAGRTFSSSPDGTKLVVTESCARYARGFLEYLYDSDAAAYDIYSTLKSEQGVITDEDSLVEMFKAYKEKGGFWVSDLLDNPKLTVKSIEAALNLDHYAAKEVRNKLVELRAIKQEHSYWVKRPHFITFLRELRKKYIRDPEWWKEISCESTLLRRGSAPSRS